MDLSKLGLKPFYHYYLDDEGNPHAVKPSETVSVSWKKIDKATYDSLTAVKPATTEADPAPIPTPAPQTGTAVAIALPQVEHASPESHGPANFQEALAALDSMIVDGTGISQLQIDMARKYVAEIMVTLKTHPEFEDILVDKDVHNVMVFVQSSMTMATAGFIEKKEKKQTRESKKKNSSHAGMTFEMIDFSMPAQESKGGMDFATAFANADSIKAIEKK